MDVALRPSIYSYVLLFCGNMELTSAHTNTNMHAAASGARNRTAGASPPPVGSCSVSILDWWLWKSESSFQCPDCSFSVSRMKAACWCCVASFGCADTLNSVWASTKPAHTDRKSVKTYICLDETQSFLLPPLHQDGHSIIFLSGETHVPPSLVIFFFTDYSS